MAEKLFRGCGTALVTLFQKNGKVDFIAQRDLMLSQIDCGIDFLVPCGTTGESPTLTDEEQIEIIKLCVECAKGRVPVLAGTGSNNTREAVHLTTLAREVGADAALVVAPYYNKPTSDGFLDYFIRVSKVGLPVIAYDIPSRTGGKGLSAELIIEMAEGGIIQGLKWASGDFDQLKRVIEGTPDDFMVFSGDDNATLELLDLGGDGVISVVSNIVPDMITDFFQEFQCGDKTDARGMFKEMLPLMEAMFLVTNPIPVKTALALINPGKINEVFRSPIVPMRDGEKAELSKVLGEYGLI